MFAAVTSDASAVVDGETTVTDCQAEVDNLCLDDDGMRHTNSDYIGQYQYLFSYDINDSVLYLENIAVPFHRMQSVEGLSTLCLKKRVNDPTLKPYSCVRFERRKVDRKQTCMKNETCKLYSRYLETFKYFCKISSKSS